MSDVFEAFQRGLAEASNADTEEKRQQRSEAEKKKKAISNLKEIQSELSRLIAQLRYQGEICFSQTEIVEELPYELLFANNAGCELRFPSIEDGPSVMVLKDMTYLVYQPSSGYEGAKWIWEARTQTEAIECVARCLARRSIGRDYLGQHPM